MVELRKLRNLKRQQMRIVSQFETNNPLSLLNPDYVSSTGLTVEDIAEKIDKIKDCATLIELTDNFVQVGDTWEQVLSVSAANYCKQPVICPVCASRMQARRKAKLSDPIKEQAQLCAESFTVDGEEKKRRYAYMITYTITDGDSLSERMETLKESKKNFRKMGQRRKNGKRSGGETSKIVGGVSTVEIKRGKYSGQWHVHQHDLVFTDEPLNYRVYQETAKRKLDQKYGRNIPREELNKIALIKAKFRDKLVAVSKMSFEWLRATGGDSIDIRVDPIKHIPKSAKGKKKRMFEKMTFPESVLYQAKEVMKYPFKPNDFSTADSLEILSDTFNKRMVATYGVFYGIPGDDYNDELDNSEHFIMKWNGKTWIDPKPGTVRENEDTQEARKKVGIELGEYRRKRRLMVDRYTTPWGVSSVLYLRLNELKKCFRAKCAAVWQRYREKKKRSELQEKAKCDTYSVVLALDGYYLPGATSREIMLEGWQ